MHYAWSPTARILLRMAPSATAAPETAPTGFDPTIGFDDLLTWLLLLGGVGLAFLVVFTAAAWWLARRVPAEDGGDR